MVPYTQRIGLDISTIVYKRDLKTVILFLLYLIHARYNKIGKIKLIRVQCNRESIKGSTNTHYIRNRREPNKNAVSECIVNSFRN